MMWNISNAKIREEIYYSLIGHGLYIEEQKGCHKGTREIGNLPYIDQHILYESAMKNVVMMWIDYKSIQYGAVELGNRLSQNI